MLSGLAAIDTGDAVHVGRYGGRKWKGYGETVEREDPLLIGYVDVDTGTTYQLQRAYPEDDIELWLDGRIEDNIDGSDLEIVAGKLEAMDLRDPCEPAPPVRPHGFLPTITLVGIEIMRHEIEEDQPPHWDHLLENVRERYPEIEEGTEEEEDLKGAISHATTTLEMNGHITPGRFFDYPDSVRKGHRITPDAKTFYRILYEEHC